MEIEIGSNQRWIFKKHINNINLLNEVALYLKANRAGISMEEKDRMYEEFSKSPLYNPRDSLRNKPLDAINHKLDGLNYFMFGYSAKLSGDYKFIFSPLGNLYLKYISNETSRAKIFATMLLGMQLPHPASKTSEDLSVYPFRLIFQLLLDDRLGGKLYHYEVYRYIIYVTKIDVDSYENLVFTLLESRKLTFEEKKQFLKSCEYDIVKTIYEWQYYISKILEDMKIIDIVVENKKESIKLFHPSKPTSKSAPTSRTANNGYIRLNPIVQRLLKELLKKYSVFSTPINLKDPNRAISDIVKEIYSFYPNELLVEIGEETDTLSNKLLELPKLINQYSLNPENSTANQFEDVLEEAFNMFYNVEAQKLAGAGRTDIECVNLEEKTKFAVEAKSTANKLSQINAGRLSRHRDLIGGQYTIVVTPKYVPSVKYDIKGQDIVIIKANTLAEYLYNNILMNNRDLNYEEIHSIVKESLGEDISDKISELTLSKFG